jgi:ERCC4-type nuclease
VILQTTPISVDSQEKDAQETASYFVLNDIKAMIEPLKAGDIWWAVEENGSFGWELKSAQDALHSLWSKEDGERLEWQLGRLRDFVDYPVLGIHGLLTGAGETLSLNSEPKRARNGDYYMSRIFKNTGYTKASVDSFLWSIQHPATGRPVTVVKRETKEDLLRAIIAVHRWSLKEKHETFEHTPIRVRHDLPPSRSCLISLGVGEKRTDALLERWGNAGRVLCEISDSDLLTTPGVGPDTIRKIRGIWT